MAENGYMNTVETINMKTPVTIKDPRGYTRTVGFFMDYGEYGNIYFKEVKRAKHFMRVLSGYGIQKEVYDKIKNKVKWVIIFEKDTNNRLLSKMDVWKEHSSAQNYGFGKQVFLSEKYMEVLAPPPLLLVKEINEPKENENPQKDGEVCQAEQARLI